MARILADAHPDVPRRYPTRPAPEPVRAVSEAAGTPPAPPKRQPGSAGETRPAPSSAPGPTAARPPAATLPAATTPPIPQAAGSPRPLGPSDVARRAGKSVDVVAEAVVSAGKAPPQPSGSRKPTSTPATVAVLAPRERRRDHRAAGQAPDRAHRAAPPARGPS